MKKKKTNKLSKKQKKFLTFSVVGIIANVALCAGIIAIIFNLVDTNEKLSKYRDLQNKQIASVTELCFDIGVSNSILHNNYSQDRSAINIIMSVAKDEYANLYNSTYDNICFKPLALISGSEFESNGTAEEKAKPLLEDRTQGGATDAVSNSKYSVIDNAFDKVRW